MPEFSDPDRFEQLASNWLRHDDVSKGQMFGWVGLKAGRRFFALSVEGHLIVKLPLTEVDALVENSEATRFDPGWGRIKKSWADVGPLQLSLWKELLERAYRHVVALEQEP